MHYLFLSCHPLIMARHRNVRRLDFDEGIALLLNISLPFSLFQREISVTFMVALSRMRSRYHPLLHVSVCDVQRRLILFLFLAQFMYPHSNTGIALSSYMKPHPLETQSEKSPSSAGASGAPTQATQPSSQPSQPVLPSQYLISEPSVKKPDKGKC